MKKNKNQISAMGQSLNTMHSSDDYQELAEENKSLLVKLKQRNETVSSLEKIIEKLLKLPPNKGINSGS